MGPSPPHVVGFPGFSVCASVELFYFGLVNLNHARAAASVLEHDVLSLGLDMIGITEPYFYNDQICGRPPGFIQVAYPNEPRAALFIKSQIHFVTLLAERDLVALSTSWNERELLVICGYCPPSASLEDFLVRLENFCLKFPAHPLVLMGDFNAKSSAWSPRPTDDRGRILLEFIHRTDLYIENHPDSIPTYFSENKGESWIDLVLTKNLARTPVKSWTVREDINCSDHRLITFSLGEANRSTHSRTIWKLMNLTTTEFKIALRDLIDEFKVEKFSKSNLDQLLRDFSSKLVTICRMCHKKSNKKKSTSAIWWTSDLEIERKRVRAYRRRYQACPDQSHRLAGKIIFKKALSVFKSHIASAKVSGFRSFLDKLVEKNHLGDVKNIVKLDNIDFSISRILLANGESLTSYQECRDHILKTHFPHSDEAPFLDDLDDDFQSVGQFPEFNIEEVECCIGSFKKDKAPGEDGFSMDIIAEIFFTDRAWFTEILNLCFRWGQFPECWKEARVVLIPKSGKDQSNPAGYRPICLLAVWGKILDKLMTKRLTFFLESNDLLDERQFGFREGKGTSLALLNVTKFLDRAKAEKQVSCMISLDIRNAFNSARWNDLLQILKTLGVPSRLRALYRSFLSDRSVFLSDGSCWYYNIGVPQGSSSAPILWLLIANEALRIFPSSPDFLIQAFADDLVILMKASASFHFTANSGALIAKLEDWALRYHLGFSEGKSNYTMFKFKKLITHFPSIKICGKKIGYTKELKYLGIIFDPNRTFLPHLNHIKEKVIKIFEKIRRIARATWGLRPRMIKEIYLSIVERIILYGVETWYRGTVKMKVKLLQIQRHPLLSITKAYRTISTEAVQVLSGCLPLDLKANMEAESFRRIQGNIGAGEKNFEEKIRITPWQVKRCGWQHYEGQRKETAIFTDGSKLGDRVGCALVLYEGDREILHKKYRLSNNCSVFMAEVVAISKAVELILERGIIEVDILSDSMSALSALASLKENRKILNNIKDQIIGHNGNISLFWIRAHCGFIGNERADFLAKEATQQVIVDLEFCDPRSSIKTQERGKAMSEWQCRWTNSTKGKDTREVFALVDLRRLKGDFYINQIISGHGVLPTHQHRFFGKPLLCHCGESEGSRDHVLFHCTLWDRERNSSGYQPGVPLGTLLQKDSFAGFSRTIVKSLLTFALADLDLIVD